MRFSSLFQAHAPQRVAAGESVPREKPQPVAAPDAELPEDLDARVRLVGEWQQLEG